MNPVLPNKQTVIVYIVGLLVLYFILIQLNILSNPFETKKASKFRKMPELQPEYFREDMKNILASLNTTELKTLSPLFSKVLNDFKAKQPSILDTIINEKGVFYDDEEKAVQALMRIKSRMELSAFSSFFDVETKKYWTIFGSIIKTDFVGWLDSYLENTYQSKLYKYFKSLPYAPEDTEKKFREVTGETLKSVIGKK